MNRRMCKWERWVQEDHVYVDGWTMSREVERREAPEFVKNGDKIDAEIVLNASYEH